LHLQRQTLSRCSGSVDVATVWPLSPRVAE
jgi:hypothetical protein